LARIWEPFLSERDRLGFEAAGYSAHAGFGERPALPIINVHYDFCGDSPEPIPDAIKTWRTSCGEDAWTALEYIEPTGDLNRIQER
jgi:maleamate amidohydrolase